jgi:hypothetical protein
VLTLTAPLMRRRAATQNRGAQGGQGVTRWSRGARWSRRASTGLRTRTRPYDNTIHGVEP